MKFLVVVAPPSIYHMGKHRNKVVVGIVVKGVVGEFGEDIREIFSM